MRARLGLSVFLFFQIQPDVVYEIPVAAPGRQLVRVSVTLPEQFPYQPPVIQVCQRATVSSSFVLTLRR